MTAKLSHDEIAARLYLQAVLPAFEELAQVSPRARRLIAGWNCSVEFAVRGNGGAAISFKDGAVSFSPQRCADATISLFYLSSAQLVNQFAGRGFSLPLPRRGILRVASLMRFNRIGKILADELEQHPRLLMSTALGALPVLIGHDERSREMMRDCPEGLAQFSVPSFDLHGWAEWKNGKITWGRGHAKQRADVEVIFNDEATALAALRGELDELAAIGNGNLTVRGLVPLADMLGAVMARAEIYIEKRNAKMDDGG